MTIADPRPTLSSFIPAGQCMTRRQSVAFSFLLVIAVLGVYWPGLGGGFAFDDYPNIVFNTRLHVTTLSWPDWLAALFSSYASDLQRPLAMASFAAQHYFTGLDPWAMKLANVLVHALNALLAFGCVRALGRTVPASGNLTRDQRALSTATLWAVLPINLMAVLLIVQRMESLSHTFVLGGMWLYLHGRLRQQQGRRGGLLAFVGLGLGTGLGVLCKESAILLPLYTFCVELFCLGFRREPASRADRKLITAYVLALWLPAIAGGLWLLERSTAPGAYASRDFTLGERLLTEPRVLMDYVRWTLLPSLRELSLFHDDYLISRSWMEPGSTLPALAALGVLAGLACLLARKQRPLSALGIAWFLAAHTLTATFIPLELVYEHRNYFASLGLMLTLVDLLSLTSRATASVLLVAIGFFYASTTWLRAQEWNDPLRFAVTSAAKHPLSPRATYQLGQTYVILSNGDLHSPFTQAAFDALEAARRVPNGNILPAQGLLMFAARTGQPMRAEWWLEMERRLHRGPIGPQETSALAAMTECAIAKRCPFPEEKMQSLFKSALSHGENPEVLNIYGNYVLNVLGRPGMALQLWALAVERAPTQIQYRINYARLLIATGRTAQALQQTEVIRRMGSIGETEAIARALEKQAQATQ